MRWTISISVRNGAWWRRSASIISAPLIISRSATPPISPITTISAARALALVYKPTENSSVYFSYGTSFNPSAETLSLSASNQGLGPERDHTFEVGGKVEVLDGLLALTAAAFNTVMTNARISDPDNPGLQELAGTERVNGIELGAQGHLTENWELIAGYTYLAPRAVGPDRGGRAGTDPQRRPQPGQSLDRL